MPFSIQNEREWANPCRDVLLRPEVATDGRFTSNSLRVRHRNGFDAGMEAAAPAAIPAMPVLPADRPLSHAARAMEALCRETLRDLVRSGIWHAAHMRVAG